MPASPAVSVAPFAIVVLAWDETKPAVRTLLGAAQATDLALDSILVLVPQADAPSTVSAEEYLPLPASTITELAAQLASPAPAEVVPTAADAAPTTLPLPAIGPLPLASPLPAPPHEPAASAAAAPVSLASATEPVGDTPPSLAWTTVRVLRLSSFSLPALAQRAGQALPAATWTGPAVAPAAPYLGATSAGVGPAPVARPAQPATGAIATTQPAAQNSTTAPLKPYSPPARLASRPQPSTAPMQPMADSVALAADLEADTLPLAAEALASFELAHANLPAAAAELLADQPAGPNEDLAPAELLPAQASWPEALAALRQPAREDEPVLPAAPAKLPATAQVYSAPNLNFQIIQYARFAVPLALAESPFQAIYAPAWPTWLAAQELRQRTGQPLVLHVSALAAGAEESLETATGWIAELQRQALRRADLVLVETIALAHRLRHELGLPAAAVRIIPAADAAAVAQALGAAQPRAKSSMG